MCGIAGMLGRPVDSIIRRVLDAQKHRGPDGRRVSVVPGGIGLGHDRLAIIDVAGGAQPLWNEDGTLAAVVNGEIYNHQELRSQLEERHTFQTRSDSEVVLHLFEEEGPEFVRRLDGMFAIAIWGPVHGLFLARDPLGIKPLYYGRDVTENLLFASEIKGLIPEVDQVLDLPPGTYWMPGRPPVRYYHLPATESVLTDEATAVTVVNRLLTAAVRKRLMADVPLGVFLSGGLDSSLIAAIAVKHSEGRMHSFCVGLEGSADVVSARKVARFLGTEHHERLLTPREVIGAVPAVISLLESCDPALVRSAIPTYFVSELAAKHVKVALSGEGADEIFAGYHYLREFDSQALGDELRRTTAELHNLNLQRVDRMTMAHGLEGRVPFLDIALVDAAFRIAPELKWLAGQGKWVLRKVAEKYLPTDIAWRTKEKFAIGTGIGPLLERHADTLFASGDVPPAWTPEAWWYWTVFREHFDRPDLVALMGRSRSLNPGQRWLAGFPLGPVGAN